jgi:hypothetical protein
MLGPFDYALWLIGFLGEVYVVLHAIRHGDFLRYFTLNVYLLGLALNSAIRYVVFRACGVSSTQYRYCYQYTDALLTLVMFATVISLYSHVFGDSGTAKHIRVLATIALSTTLVYSFLAVEKSRELFTTRIVAEFAANLYFVGVVLTYILWTVVLKGRGPRLRLVLIITAFGIFFGGHTVTYSLYSFFPHVALWRYIPPLLGTWLPLSLAYTFARVSETARIPIEQVERAS